jgi:hypothetical protein
MNQLIRNGIIAGVLSFAASSQAAIYCAGDAECLSKSISLIKRATKAGCDASALASRARQPILSSSDLDGSLITSIETCIEKQKYAKNVEKKTQKRIERLEKALTR